MFNPTLLFSVYNQGLPDSWSRPPSARLPFLFNDEDEDASGVIKDASDTTKDEYASDFEGPISTTPNEGEVVDEDVAAIIA